MEEGPRRRDNNVTKGKDEGKNIKKRRASQFQHFANL